MNDGASMRERAARRIRAVAAKLAGTRPDQSRADLAAALAAHQSGRFSEAEALYDTILSRTPDHFDASHMLGVLALQTGRAEMGIERLSRAVALRPGNALAHFNLGKGLHTQGRLEEALVQYDRAVAAQPDHVEAHLGRGAVLQALRRFDEALGCYDAVIRLRPDYGAAHHNRGLILSELGRHQDALASHEQAVRLQPNDPDTHFQHGNLLRQVGRPGDALASYERAIALRPAHAEAWSNRGALLRGFGEYDEALASQEKAIALRPDYAEAHTNRGATLREMARTQEALRAFDQAIALNPGLAEVCSNRAVVLMEMKRFEEAQASLEKAIALKPDLPGAFWNLGLLNLTLGRYEEGWRLFEWRKRLEHAIGDRPVPRPLWTGAEPLEGRSIFLHWEQGYGDTIQFCRYVPIVRALGATVILSVQEPLRTLIARMDPAVPVLGPIDMPDPVDYHCPMMSLPHALGTTLETIPDAIPYLLADEEKVAAWRARLAEAVGLKVGLVWAGGAREEMPHLMMADARRSITLSAYAPLAAVPNVTFVSLQKGPPAAQSAQPPRRMVLRDWTGELHDFDDTAALVQALDLVITVDTAVAHVAGALGKPVWVLSRFDNCWRWLEDRSDSPWYPTARVFRQKVMGQWAPVIDAVAEALAAMPRP
jgi:tetratricopeptide (TPR) repeat protein